MLKRTISTDGQLVRNHPKLYFSCSYLCCCCRIYPSRYHLQKVIFHFTECNKSPDNLFTIQIIREDLVTELRYHLTSFPELINTTDNAGYKPVHVAAKYNRVSSLAVLLDWKAGMSMLLV